MLLNQFARDAAAHEICPTEFTEGRFVLGVYASPFECPCQRAKGIVDEVIYRSRHVIVGAPPALIVEWMGPLVIFKCFPEFVETVPPQVCHDRDRELRDTFVV